jgi:capsular polysaccharide transport system permease protein
VSSDATNPSARLTPWSFQLRVIKALVLRDFVARYGNSRLGFVWFVIQPILYMVTLLLVFTVRDRLAPPNIPLLIFLMTGFPVYHVFAGMWSQMSGGSNAGDPLLMFPQITQMDLLIAKAVLEFASQFVAMVFITIAFVVIGGMELPADPWAVILCYWAAQLLGLGLGLNIGALRRLFPTIETWTSPVRRLGGFVSGVIHVAAAMPLFLLPYFSWNPVFKTIEMARQSWYPTYQTPIWDPWYVVWCIIGLLAAGLVLERGTRRYIGR